MGEIDGRHYITMAYIQGRPLSNYIGGSKPLEQKAVAVIVRKLASALADAHTTGVIHRDLKPANVMVDENRQPLVMDFGLARRENEMQSRMTQSGTILGTPAYMSPEQVTGKTDEIGPRADIYSLGIILYELLTGRLPFEGSVAAVIGQILTQPPAPPSQLREDIDPALEAICQKMIAKEQTDRYASMNEVAAELGDYLKGLQPSAVDSPTSQSVPPEAWDVLSLPDVNAAPLLPTQTQGAGAKPRRQVSFLKTKAGLYTMIGSAAVALILLATVITIIFRTPYGTLTIVTDDPDLVVEVDGRQIKFRDGSTHRLKNGEHELALRIGDASLPIGSRGTFHIVGREGEYRLSAKFGETELRNSRFTINKGDNPALVISLVRENLTNETGVATKEASDVPKTASREDTKSREPEATSSRSVPKEIATSTDAAVPDASSGMGRLV